MQDSIDLLLGETDGSSDQGGEQSFEAMKAKTDTLSAEKDLAQKRYDDLQKKFNERDTEISSLRRKVQESSTENADDDANASYLKERGFMTADEFDRKMDERELRVSAMRTAQEQEQTIKQRAEQIRTEMDETTAKHPFVNRTELLQYMKGKPGLTVQEAAKLKYENEFEKVRNGAQGVLSDFGGRGSAEEPETQNLNASFKNRSGFFKRIDETLNNAGL